MDISYNTSNWQLGSYLADRFSVMKKVESVKLAAYFEGSSIAIGIGYDLLQHTNAEIEEDIGIVLSTSQKTLLDEARGPGIGSVRLGQIAGELSLAITVTQAEQAFLKVAPTYEARLNSILGGVTIPESSERIALFSMVYQGRFQNYSDLANAPRVKDNLLLALSGGNRAEAWYVVRYQSSFARNPAHANGFAKRAYYESELFGLYDNPSSVTADDAKQVYRIFQLHRADILKYENTYSAQIAAANSDYGLSVVTQAAVDTLTQALTPAYESLFADLQTKYSIGMAGLGASDFSPLNVYLDPNRDPGQSVVVLDNPNHSAFLTSAVNPVTGAEVATRDILIGEGGNDYLMGGKGDDVLIGGTGLDYYYWRTGDGDDRIIDEDRQGIIVINDGAHDLYASGAFIKQGTSNVWQKITPDGVLTLTHNSPWKIVAEDGSEILLGDDFQDGDFGIHLVDTQLTPPNVITGADGYSDALTGSGGADRMLGLSGNDALDGSAGDDIIEGGVGDDLIGGNSGSDLIYGGSGKDMILSATGLNAPQRDANHDGVYEDWAPPAGSGAVWTQGRTWGIYANANGSYTVDGGGSLAQDSAGDIVFAGDDDDRVVGGLGDDYIDGGLNNDTLTGHGGNDVIDGGDGNDTLQGDGTLAPGYFQTVDAAQHGNDVLDGGAGNDDLFGGGKDDGLFGGIGNDRLWGDDATEADLGGTYHGSDYLDGGADDDQLIGGGKDDYLIGGAGADLLWGDADDEIKLGGQYHGNDYLDGGDGNDQLVGGGGGDILDGGAGADYLDGGTGTDIMAGGADDDTYIVDDAGDVVIENSGEGNDTVNSSVSIAMPDNVEWLNLAGVGDINATGNADRNYLTGNAGANQLSGGEGDDQLIGGSGDDTLIGGTLNDYLAGGSNNDVYVFNRGDGQDSIDNTDLLSATDTLRFGAGIVDTDVLGLQFGTDMVLKLKGTTDQIAFINYFGADTVDGSAVSDHKIDRVEFSNGVMWDQAMIQTVVDRAANNHAPTVNIFLPTLRANVAELFTYTVPLNTIIDPDAGDSVTYRVTMPDGTALPSWLSFDAATRTFSGTPGAGDIGSFEFTLSGVDNYGYFTSETVRLSVLQGFTLNGTPGDDSLTGGDGNDVLNGFAGNDVLYGYAGNDTFDGGAGNDRIGGGGYGLGSDTYLFGKGDGQDVIDYTSPDVAGKTDTLQFKSGVTASEVVLSTSGTSLIIKIDGTTDQITVNSFFSQDNPTNVYNPLQQIKFADGTIWSVTDILVQLYAGTDNADTLNGTVNADTINGQGGNDTLYGKAGNDVLDGGVGADFVYGGDGDDIVRGGQDNDTLYGDAGNDTLDGGAGADVLYGDAGNDTLDGGVDADMLYGGAGDDFYVNVTGDDTIGDYTGNNTIQLAATSIGVTGLTTVQVPNGTGGYYLQLQISLNTGGSVKLNSPFFTNGSDTLQFSDGNAINLETLVGEQLFTPLNLMLNSLGGRIYGGAGADYLYGWTGRDTLIGHRGNDRLYGDGNDDTLIGGEGNDLIHGGGGNDTIDGGSGNDDMYGYGSSGEQTPPPDGNDTYLFGRGYGQDRIFESSAVAGNVDVVQMQGGVSTTDVTVTRDGLGHMHLSINGTTDKLTIYNYFLGDAYKVEQIRFADGAVWDGAMLAALSSQNHAPALTDEIADLSIPEGAPFSFTVPLGTFTDPDADDVLVYSATLADGSALPSWLDFDPATRTFSGTPSTAVTLNVSVTAKDAGNLTATDTFDITVVGVPNVTLNGTSATDTLNGGAGHDTLNGLAGNDTLNGNAGNDRLDGGTGIDTMRGGTGDDVYVVDSTADIVTENANEGIDTVESSVTLTLATNVEKLILTGTSAINGTGNTLSNTITGNSANNTLSGGTGADTLIGGAGNDTYIVDNTGDVVTELANEGSDLVQASVTTTLAANVENLTLTGTTAINGTGNTLDNVLTGNSANNTLTGGAGNDRINGGTGNDTMVGGTGDDTYVVNVATDIVNENANEGIDTIESSVTLTLANNVENLTLTGTSAINGTGNILDNVLTGNSAVNTLTGGAGNDRLDGKGGADKMLGGIGDDTYVVDKTTDVITENANEGLDTVESTFTLTLGNNVENLTLMGTSAINGTGNTLNNRLQGNSAVNSLSGAAGNDTLEGMGGADTLTGGTGNDTYVLGRGYAADTVVENDTTTGNTDVAQFLTGVAADQIWFKKATNNLEVSIIGTSDKLVIKDWYLGNAYHVEQFKTTDGAKTLTDSNVQNLVNAMASFAPPAAGQTTLPTNHQTSLAPVIAANWQ